MAGKTSATSTKTTDPRATTPDQPPRPRLDTGQEPDPRGVHIPGAAPGQFTDLGPVSVTHNPSRSAR